MAEAALKRDVQWSHRDIEDSVLWTKHARTSIPIFTPIWTFLPRQNDSGDRDGLRQNI